MPKKELKEYRIWKAMKSRCYAPCYKNSYYQIDNIKVCDRWKNSFENFIKDMGKMPSQDCSIERIDIKKNYCPENCKWIPISEQAKNRRISLIYTYKGKSMILKDWSKHLGIKYTTLYQRIFREHLTFEQAINIKEEKIEINGISKKVSEWCEYYNLKKGNVYSRIHRGWTRYDAIMKNQEKIKENKHGSNN